MTLCLYTLCLHGTPNSLYNGKMRGYLEARGKKL